MTGRRELWEVTRFSGPRRGFQPQCDCYRTDDPPALHLLLELPASTRPPCGSSPSAPRSSSPACVSDRIRPPRATTRSRSSTARSSGASSSARTSTPTRATATYEAGMLRLEVPLAMSEMEFTETPPDAGRRDPGRAAGAAAQGDGRLPRVDDAARDRAGALDPRWSTTSSAASACSRSSRCATRTSRRPAGTTCTRSGRRRSCTR